MIFFMIWQDEEEKLKEFLKILNSCHPTLNFTAEYSLDKVDLINVEVTRRGNNLLTDFYIKPRRLTNTYNFHLVTYLITKNLFHIARLSVLIGFVHKKKEKQTCI